MSSWTIFHLDSERSWRGGEQQLLYLVRYLSEQGHENVLLCPPGTPLAEKAAGQGFRTTAWNPLGEWDLPSVWRLRCILKKHPGAILHSHTGHTATLSFLAGAGLPVHRVVHRRVDFPIRSRWSRIFTYGRAACVIAISEGIREVLSRSGIPAGKIRVIPSSVSPRFFEFAPGEAYRRRIRSELGLENSSTLLVQVAALAPHKDQENLLSAFERLSPRYPSLHLILAGEGPLRSKLQDRASALPCAGRIHFLGFREDVPEILAGSDVFVLSSYLEGLGSVLLEAMAVGLPIVATRTGGIPEIVQDRLNGLLVSPKQPVLLAEAIAWMLDHPGQARTYAGKARERARDFHPNRMGQETEAVYRELMIR